MADLVPSGEIPWFTKELQDKLLASARTGLKTKWVALLHGVTPGGLRMLLERGADKTSGEPFRSFYIRWIRKRAECMNDIHALWVAGDKNALTVLTELFPSVYGKAAEADWDPFAAGTMAEDMAQLEAILDRPAEFGLLDLFAKHGRLRADGS